MSLTDVAVRNAVPKTTRYKLFDTGGLYIEVAPSGGKWWRFRYTINGKENRLSLGTYPEVSLKVARERRDEQRNLLADGLNPSLERKAAKQRQVFVTGNTFEAVARQWLVEAHEGKSERTKTKARNWLEKDVFPFIGARPISELTVSDVRGVLLRVKSRGALETVKRVHATCSRVFRFAIGHELATRDPAADIDLDYVLPARDVQHHASVKTPTEAGQLMRAIGGFEGTLTTRCALRVAPYVFVRPGELRTMEWRELDFDRAEWRIPARKMKMKEQHIVPLAPQVIEILREMEAHSGSGQYVFPSERGAGRPMSENTINAALRRLGYSKDQQTGHGFRSMASTLLHELGYPHMMIERQLAHGERNKVSASYNFAEYLPERRKMMSEWANYLDGLKAGGNVIPLRGNAA